MSKFVGKFRRDKNYYDDSDDNYGNFVKRKKKKGENPEIKKLMRMCREEDNQYNFNGDYHRYRK